jgi:hypothetical protein
MFISPAEYASVQEAQRVEKLRELFVLFYELCAEGVLLDARLVRPEQMPFHRELEIGLEDVRMFLAQYLDNDKLRGPEVDNASSQGSLDGYVVLSNGDRSSTQS